MKRIAFWAMAFFISTGMTNNVLAGLSPPPTVPEPSTAILVGIGILAAAGFGRQKNK